MIAGEKILKMEVFRTIGLISSVYSIKLSIDGDVQLSTELDTNFKIIKSVQKQDSSLEHGNGRRVAKSEALSEESSDVSSEDGSKEIPIVITSERSTTKTHKKKHFPTTTPFTTKYERGTTAKYTETFRAHHHHKRHGKRQKNVFGYTIPKWPQMPTLIVNSEERPTVYPQAKHSTNKWGKPDPQAKYNTDNRGQVVTQIGWFDVSNNSGDSIFDMFNQAADWVKPTNRPKTTTPLVHEIINKTDIANANQQFQDKFKDFADQTDKLQDNMKNKSQNLKDKIEQYNQGVQNWQEQMKNKTQQQFSDQFNDLTNQANKWQGDLKNKSKDFGDQFNDLSNQANKLQGDITNKGKEFGGQINDFGKEASKWQEQAKDIVKPKEIGKKYQDISNEVNKWQGQADNKQKDLGSQFGNQFNNLGNKFGSEASKWQGQANDKQKELGNQFNNMDNKFGNEASKWQGQANDKQKEFGDKFNNEASKWKGEANKWQGEAANKQKQLDNQFNKFGNEASKWQGQANDKQKELGNQFGNMGNKFGNEASKWQGQAKDKQKELGNQFSDQASKWQGDAKNKQKELGNQFNDVGNKWQGQAIDKQKELGNKFNDMGTKFGGEASKWQGQAQDKQKELGNQFNYIGNKWQGQAKDKQKELGNQFNDVGNKFGGEAGKLQGQASSYMNNQGNKWKQYGNDSVNKIKDNLPLSAFTKHILVSTLNVFDKVKNESTEYHWKKKVNKLAKNYEEKYKEFLRSSRHQKIKTRLGAQKVVLNAIDMSKNIVDRLINVMINEMDKKGLLRSSHTQDIFYKEIKKEVDRELQYACLNLGVCITHSGFIQTVMDVLKKMLFVDEEKFRQAFDSLTEAAKYADFSRSLGKKNDNALKRKLDRFDEEDVFTKRSMIMIAKNIIANRNKPLILTTDVDPLECNLNQTIAFLEVIDTLDKNVPDSKQNIKKLYDMRINLGGWSRGHNIQYTMSQFVFLIKSALDELHGAAWNIIRHNTDIILS